MQTEVQRIWPEIGWIKNETLRKQVTEAWEYALDNSVLTPNDLETIPFSLLVKDGSVSFMNHKRTCVQLSVDIARRMQENFGDAISIDMDILTAGAILIDIGKLQEYALVDGKLVTSDAGKIVRHPFSGVAVADRFGLPPEVLHIIATHSKEGDLGHRTVESIIVHHADFVSFEPFKE